MLEGVAGQLHATRRAEVAGQAALPVRDCASDERADLLVGERLQAPDPESAQEGRVDLEVRIFRRRADQRDRAVLDLRQQRVLLGLVEAVNLIEEEHGLRAAGREALAGLCDDATDLDDAAHHRAEASRSGRRPCRRAAGQGWSCRCPAGPTGGSTRDGRGRRPSGAGRAPRRDAPVRRTRPASGAASARRAAGRRAAAGTGPRVSLRQYGGWAWRCDGTRASARRRPWLPAIGPAHLPIDGLASASVPLMRASGAWFTGEPRRWAVLPPRIPRLPLARRE